MIAWIITSQRAVAERAASALGPVERPSVKMESMAPRGSWRTWRARASSRRGLATSQRHNEKEREKHTGCEKRYNKGEEGKYATTQRNKGPHSRSTTLGGSAQHDAIRSPEGFRLMLVLIGSGAGLVSSCDHRHCTLHAGINNHTRVSISACEEQANLGHNHSRSRNERMRGKYTAAVTHAREKNALTHTKTPRR